MLGGMFSGLFHVTWTCFLKGWVEMSLPCKLMEALIVHVRGRVRDKGVRETLALQGCCLGSTKQFKLKTLKA